VGIAFLGVGWGGHWVLDAERKRREIYLALNSSFSFKNMHFR
jgi:hypothetical protein